MPASNERVQNKGLSGSELSTIIQNRVKEVMSRDGMFVDRIAYQRVKFEVRVTLHLDNPLYPKHITSVLAPNYSDQDLQNNPELATLERGPLPLTEPLTADSAVVSVQVDEVIASPNGARIEHDMKLKMDVTNREKGFIEEKQISYSGDKPNLEALGNTVEVKDTSAEEAGRMGVKLGGKKGKP
ncbi:MAG: hypothetical protein ACREJN_08310 [Nitrospiraceae bacterium]